MKKIFIIGLFLMNSLSFAHEVRNGGNAVVCYTDNSKREIKSIELFDYWEGKRVNPSFGEIDLGGSSLSLQEKLNYFTQKMNSIDPLRARKYYEQASVILNHLDDYLTDRVSDIIIYDDNSTHVPSPPCYKEQFAVQLKDPAPGSRRFQINKKLFGSDKISNDSRIGIILHEVIYREAIEYGHTNSDKVRELNFIISSTKFNSLESEKYLDLIKMMNFVYFNNDCIPADFAFLNLKRVFISTLSGIENTVCLQSHKLSFKVNSFYGYLDAGDLLMPNKISKRGNGFLMASVQDLWVKVDGFTIDNETGKFIDMSLSSFNETQIKLQWNRDWIYCKSKNSWITFTTNGFVKSCRPLGAKTVKLANSTVSISGFAEVDNTGTYLLSAGLSRNQSLVWESTRKKELFWKTYSDYYVEFSPEGFVLKGELSKPLRRRILDQDVEITNVFGSRKGYFYSRIVYPQKIPALFNGHRVLYERGSYYDYFCKEIASKVNAISFKTSDNRDTLYVRAFEQFYSFFKNTLIGYFDQNIEVLNSVNCSLVVEFSI